MSTELKWMGTSVGLAADQSPEPRESAPVIAAPISFAIVPSAGGDTREEGAQSGEPVVHIAVATVVAALAFAFAFAASIAAAACAVAGIIATGKKVA